jgi:predicted nucleotidyltransferase
VGPIEEIFQQLNGRNVRYVVVGGLATVLHGFPRLTADVDLVIDLEPEEARRAVQALVDLGLRPRAPVEPMQFADRETRESWLREKGMRVFSFFDSKNPLRVVDLFAQEPIPFEQLWARAEVLKVGQASARVAALEDLIALKRLAGRPQDLIDVDVLERIRKRRKRDSHG